MQGTDGSDALSVARRVVATLVRSDNAPAFVRLAFHDAFTGTPGMDASVQFELQATGNPHRGTENALFTLQRAKTQLLANNAASLADLIALAGARAVEATGGPVAYVGLGRTDAASGSGNPASMLPSPRDSVATMLTLFKGNGLDETDFVALSGAHTLGQNRGDRAGSCQRCGLDDTPDSFDNQYFSRVRDGSAVFPTDRALRTHASTTSIVANFAENQAAFFSAWCTAYCKIAGGECSCSAPTLSPAPSPILPPMTTSPTQSSTEQPTPPPTREPTAVPTQQPTKEPTREPTRSPKEIPTVGVTAVNF